MCTRAPRRGGADRELAPAGADLEDPGALADAGLVEQPLDLAGLGLEQVVVPAGRRGGRRWSPRSTTSEANSAEE